MKICLTIAVGLLVCHAMAQVKVNTSIVLNSADPAQRSINGLAYPANDSAMVSVAVVGGGLLHWATVTLNADTSRLVVTPEITEMRDGIILRFLPMENSDGPSWISVPGHAARAVLRPDGLATGSGSMRTDQVAEVMLNGPAWILLNPQDDRCPPGSLAVTDRTCIDVDAVTGKRFYEAIDHCARRGGKLCSWDEYVAGCLLLQAQLNGLFNEWEWIDDTSNHTHTANQVARFTCQGQRSANVITTMVGDTRCCYHPR